MMVIIAPFLYHGSITANIQELEPRKRFTPGGITTAPACVYATDDPAFAAAHAFPWSSEESIDLYYSEDPENDDRSCVFLELPKAISERLNQPVSIYTVKNSGFSWVEEEVVGKTYRSINKVKCLAEQRFSSVTEAVQHFGGKVIIK